MLVGVKLLADAEKGAERGIKHMREKPQIGEVWQHFKGNKYTIFTANAVHSETNEQMVVYMRDGKVWVRPLEMFMRTVDEVDYCGNRFERVTT